MSGFLRLDQQLVGELLAQSHSSPRRRAHRNLHPHLDYPAHRLLVGIQPDSYIRPHCHLAADKDETLVRAHQHPAGAPKKTVAIRRSGVRGAD